MGPLVDLHRHLDGSLRPATVLELAGAAGIPVPEPLAFTAGMGLDAALGRFAFTLSLLQSADRVRRVAAEMCEDAAAEGLGTLEIRFAPQLHGGAIEAIVDGALEGIAGRAGLVLCALYGEPPALVDHLVAVGGSRPGVVGIDLAGGPTPGHNFGMKDYQGAFLRAGELGLGRTVHAGEGRPPAEIAEAILTLGAERIGHGTTLLQDPRVLDLVRDRGVTIEACLSSNVHVGAIARVEDHPLRRWLELGVRVCVNTDNTLFSATTLPNEIGLLRERLGASEAEIARTIAYGQAAAFRR